MKEAKRMVGASFDGRVEGGRRVCPRLGWGR